MLKKNLFFKVFIVLLAVFFMTGCEKTPLNQSKNTVEDTVVAQNTLIAFFNYLNDDKFDKAVELFEPTGIDSWEWLANFSPEEERDNKPLVLKNYCLATQTCLKANVLNIKKQTENDYILSVQFIKKDNNTFVLGPCCGATEEEMPSMDKFDYNVKKVNNLFKVATPPVYVP
jgi:hypothetical protein